MPDDADVRGTAEVASLVADPARARMLMALLGGQAMTATELAAEAGIAASTTSAHLAKLERSGLIAMERQGRHRYFRIARSEVAAFLEGMAGFAATHGTSRRFGPADPALRSARVCYDHLAGERAVRLFDELRERGVLAGEDGCGVTREGAAFFERFGVDLGALRSARRAFVRPCLDWSERRHHLGGALGAAILVRMLELGWIERAPAGRAVAITRRGEEGLATLFGAASAFRRIRSAAERG